MATGNPSSMMEIRDPAKEISEQISSSPPQIKGGGRLSKEIWEIIKERNPQGAKDLRENSKLQHGMSSANPSSMMATTKRPSSMMATTKRPLIYIDNHPRMEISEQMTGYHLWGSAPPQKKGGSRLAVFSSSAKNLEERCELSRRKSKLESDRLMPIWEVYQKEVDESEGFDVGDYSDKLPGFAGLTVPYTCSKDELADRLNVDAKSAIELYNKTMDAKFKLVEIEKANWCGPRTHLITFTASEENDEPKVFQAKHLMGCPMGPPTVTLCRQKGDRLGGYRRTEIYP